MRTISERGAAKDVYKRQGHRRAQVRKLRAVLRGQGLKDHEIASFFLPMQKRESALRSPPVFLVGADSLHHTLGDHGVGDLLEARDVGARDEVCLLYTSRCV